MATAESTLAAARIDRLVDDLLERRGVPERVHYAAGVLLDDRDFEAEQRYLRARLARALSAIFGFGTLAGLRVRCAVKDNVNLEVKVAPGLALDRLGRLIEVRREQCLHIGNWLEERATKPAGDHERDTIVQAVRDNPAVLVFDVFIRFIVCPHGKTPAFAAGPFNATDYVVPARLADAYELSLDIAATGAGNALRRPANALPRLDDKLAELQALAGDPGTREAKRREWIVDSVLDSWVDPDPTDPKRLARLAEHPAAEDWDKVFLARVTVPVTQSAAGAFPQPDATRLNDPGGTRDLADNSLRPIVFHPTAWHGIA